jgi:ribosomal protein L7/L12
MCVMPPLVVVVALAILAAAWYVGLIVVLAHRRRNSSNAPQRFVRREDLVLAGASEQVASLLARGDKIGAIATYRREMTPLGLTQAKIAVDALLVDARTRAFTDAGASADVARFLAEGNKIWAIKAYKEAYGASLVEAKSAVDAILAHYE